MKLTSAVLPGALALALAAGAVQAEEPAGQAVNINKADSQTLADELDGIGPVKAEAIVEFREEEGDFVTPEHLEEVNGIGTATVDTNRDRIRVD